MNKRYLVALDQGTTSSRAVIFTDSDHIILSAYPCIFPFTHIFPSFLNTSMICSTFLMASYAVRSR